MNQYFITILAKGEFSNYLDCFDNLSTLIHGNKIFTGNYLAPLCSWDFVGGLIVRESYIANQIETCPMVNHTRLTHHLQHRTACKIQNILLLLLFLLIPEMYH